MPPSAASRLGPARLSGRSTRVPVFTFRSQPGAPPVWAMRIDETAVANVDGLSHVHQFPGIVYFEGGGDSAADRSGLSAGDGFLIRPGELVEIGDPADLVAARGWGLYFTPEALDNGTTARRPADRRLAWRVHPLLRAFASDEREPLRFQVPRGERPAWTGALTAIERELHERRFGYQHAVVAHLVVLLVSVTRLVGTDGTTARSDGDLLDRVLDAVETGFTGPLSLSDVAAGLHVSPGHLTTAVRERTGRTVQEWITERRMIEARRLLLETDLPIAEVGRRSGYPDPGYFARVFRQAHRVTPRAWRTASPSPD